MDNTAPPSPASYGRGHRALEIASIAFVFGSLLWIAVRIVVATHGLGGLDRHRPRAPSAATSSRTSSRASCTGRATPCGDETTPDLRSELRDARSAFTTSIPKTSPVTTSSRRTATTASWRRPSWRSCCWSCPSSTGCVVLRVARSWRSRRSSCSAPTSSTSGRTPGPPAALGAAASAGGPHPLARAPRRSITPRRRTSTTASPSAG